MLFLDARELFGRWFQPRFELTAAEVGKRFEVYDVP